MAKVTERKKSEMVLNHDKIVLRSVFPKSNIMYFLQPAKDRQGKFAPCVKKVNSSGDMILSEKERNDYSEGRAVFFPEDHVFKITDGKAYDLSNPQDRAEWDAIKNSPFIAPNRDARDAQGNLLIDGSVSTINKAGRNGVAELYIDIPGLETERKVSRKQLVHNACSYIFEDPRGIDGQLNMARVLGRNMSNQPASDVIDYLLRIAEKDPERIIDLYTGDDMSLRLLFIEAKDKNVIYLKNKLYLYAEDIVLGATDDAVISWMKESRNKSILELIKRDTYPDLFIDSDN